MYYVYLITNTINQKKYVGITTRSIEKRWKEHINASNCESYSNYNDLLHKAIRHYGKDNFKVECIDTSDSEEDLKNKEIYYIGYYHSYMTENGYNMTYGGDLGAHVIGELSAVSKNSNAQRWEVINLLQTTTLTFKQIAEQVQLNSEDGEKLVDMINRGENFPQSSLNYPIRKNAKSISKKGINNPAAKVEAIKKVIDLLEHTNYSQTKIAEICGVHYNTVNNVNRCLYWTELHNYKNNIRKESRGDK